MIPNILTGIRVVMIAPIIYFIRTGSLKTAAVLFVLAVLTDTLDGRIARRFKMESVFGAMFDLIADRVIMTPSLIFLSIYGVLTGARAYFPLAPWSYVALIVFADMTVIAGILMYARMYRKNPEVKFPSPPVIVKATYPVQASVVFLALIKAPTVAVAACMYAAVALTIISFAVYMKKGGFVFKGEA